MDRRQRFACSIVLGSACLLSAAGWAAPPSSSPAAPDPVEGPQLVVLLAAGPGVPAPEAVVAGINHGHPPIEILKAGSPVAARVMISDRITGRVARDLMARPNDPRARLQRYIVVTYPPNTDLKVVQQALLVDPRIESVGENLRVGYSAAPNDPLFAPPSNGDPTQYQWGLHALNLPAAWDRVRGHAYVGVVDTGLMVDHPDLRAFHTDGGVTYYDGGNFRPQLSSSLGAFYPDVDELKTGTSLVGHGTHVSGIIAANPDNGIGGTGVCWHCSLMMIRDPLTGDKIAEGFTWLANRGAQVINFSGFLNLDSGKDCSNVDPTTDAGAQAICDALSLADGQDLVFTISSGNDLADINFPARDSRVLAVGGIRSQGPNAFWQEAPCPSNPSTAGCGSNYTVTPGRRMQDLVAPAKDVLSTMYLGRDWNPNLGCGDHFPQGLTATDPLPGYGTCTGTSMAAPHVAGVAGLLRSANPLLTKGDIRSLLLGYANRAGAWDSRYGYGVPNAAASVAAALGTVGGRALPNRLTPLFSFYSAAADDSFYTTVPQMAIAAISGALNSTCDPQPNGSCLQPPTFVPYAPVGPPVPGYSNFPGIPPCTVSPCTQPLPLASVYVFTTEAAPFAGAPALAPLYRMSYKDLTPGSHHRDVTYTTDTAGILAFKAAGYELDGIEGYIYSRCTPEPDCIPVGAVRLYRRYHPQRDDFAIFPESELAQKVSEGYISTGGGNEVLGYVYPNVDSDGDNLIDGFETLTGAHPLVADSDCDGLSDGQEVLNYPYSDPLGPGCAAAPVWLSVKGNDDNNCSYAAPCRTFAGALARIASGGEIDVLDSGDFGPVTLNKSVSLVSTGPLGGIQVSAGNAITIQAGANDKVVIRGLTLDGLGTGASGVSFLSGGSLYVESCTINRFFYGVDFAPANGSGKLFVTDSIIRNNSIESGGGVRLIASTGPGFVATIDGLRSEANGVGVKAENRGVVTIRNSLVAGNGWAGFSANTYAGSGGDVRMFVENSVSTHNGTNGVQANGSGVVVTISNVVVTGNQTGLGVFNGGQILSLGNNKVVANTVDGAPSQTLTNR